MKQFEIKGNTQALNDLVRMLQTFTLHNTTMIEEQITVDQLMLADTATNQKDGIIGNDRNMQSGKIEVSGHSNPTEKVLTIQLAPSMTAGTMSIYDFMGKLCKQTNLKDNRSRLEWSIEELSPGIYWYIVNSGQETAGQLFWKLR